jgi:hypothetical protein
MPTKVHAQETKQSKGKKRAAQIPPVTSTTPAVHDWEKDEARLFGTSRKANGKGRAVPTEDRNELEDVENDQVSSVGLKT